MKTFFYTISFLALLGSPASCAIEEMNNSSQEAQVEYKVGSETETEIDPPIPAQIPR